MKIEVRINKTVELDMEVDDVIEQINLFPTKEKMNCSARILNGIELTDISSCEPAEKEMIVKYLKHKLEIYQKL